MTCTCWHFNARRIFSLLYSTDYTLYLGSKLLHDFQDFRISWKNTITDMFSNLAWSDLAIGRLLFRVNWRMAGAYSFWIFIVIFDFFADKNLFSQNSIFEKFLKLRFLTLCNFSCLDEEKRPRYNGGLDNCPLFWLVEVDRTHFSFSLAPNSVDHVD